MGMTDFSSRTGGTEHAIVQQVLHAQTDADAADALIRQYMGFIRSQVLLHTHAATLDGQDDAMSIAMLAFYEAILQYKRVRGAFLPFAARAIRNRLIDHYRAEQRHSGQLSLHTAVGEQGERTLEDVIEDPNNAIETRALRQASREEIEEFSAQLAGLGVQLPAVADNCPRQARTFAACRRVLDYARSQPQLLDELVRTGRLPISALAAGSGVDKKTIERHRTYLVAVLVAFTNGYEIIRGHLCQLIPIKEGRT